jgi:VCBS repeat-containing protein
VLTEADGALSTGGTLTSTDVDNDNNSFTANTVTGTNGNFAISENGAWTFTANSAFDSLNDGESVTETFAVTSVDGTASSVTVTINGTNDAPIITSVAQVGGTVEDGMQIASGQVTSSDVDAASTAAYSTDGQAQHGTFAVDAGTGAWTYTLTNGDAAVQALNADETLTETFTVTVTDDNGATAAQDVVVTITGTNDIPTITSAAQVADLVEDGVQVASGQVISSDVDATATAEYTTSNVASYGTFTLDAATGEWGYTLTNGDAAVQALNVGQALTETFSVTVTDDNNATATQNVVVTITGTNDGATVSAGDETLAETGAALTFSGTLTSSDVDNADNTFTASTATVDNGTFSIDVGGVWSFVASSAFDTLSVGESIVETFNVTSVDGTASTVNVTITGTNDAPVAQADVGADVAEDASISGQLSATDVDLPTGAVLTFTTTSAATGLTLNANGSYSFDAGSYDSLALGAVEVIEVPVTVTDDQGATDTMTLTIRVTGTNDSATVTGAEINLLETDTALSTGGTLTIADADDGEALVLAQTDVAGDNGTFNIAANGVWTYVANSTLNELNAGDKLTESFEVTSADGTGTNTVVVNITGTNDIAELTSYTGVLPASEAAESISGTLTLTDLDATDATVVVQSNSVGALGTFSVGSDGAWTYNKAAINQAAGTIVRTGGDNVIIKGVGIDTITVGDGADIILAGGGANTITGTGGNKSVHTGAGVDTVTLGDGDNQIVTGDGASTIVVTDGNNVISAGAGIDVIAVGDGDNIISAGDGANRITVGDGANRVWGGDGIDVITVGGVKTNIDGTPGIDGDTYIYGGDGLNTLTSGSGNDTVISGGGVDFISTGGGDDLILVTGGFNKVWAGAGSDTLVVDFSDATISVVNTFGGGTLADGYDGTLFGNGGTYFYDVETFDITSGSGNDTITGGDGDDIIDSGSGHDTIIGGDGDNIIDSGSGHDTIIGGDGDDIIDTGTGLDTVVAGGGSDYIYGNAGDTIDGGEGGPTDNDTLNLGLGNEANTIIFYTADVNDPNNPGSDSANAPTENGFVEFISEGLFLSFENIENIVFEGPRDEGPRDPTITLQEPDPELFTVPNLTDSFVVKTTDGSSSTVTINIGGTHDVVEIKGTSAGDETVEGAVNDEVIIGGVGNDTLIGGAGDDIFVWNLADDVAGVTLASDVITDFGTGNDSILLNDLLDPANFSDSASLSVALADFMAITDDGEGSTLISISSGGIDTPVDQVITLDSVSIADLGASGDQASMIQDLLDAGKLHVDI